MFWKRKAYMSAASSIRFDVGLPAPWPAFDSMRMSTGASPAWQYCIWAANLNEWAGTTRSSWSAVITSVAGYSTPSRMLCSGEYL